MQWYFLVFSLNGKNYRSLLLDIYDISKKSRINKKKQNKIEQNKNKQKTGSYGSFVLLSPSESLSRHSIAILIIVKIFGKQLYSMT